MVCAAPAQRLAGAGGRDQRARVRRRSAQRAPPSGGIEVPAFLRKRRAKK